MTVRINPVLLSVIDTPVKVVQSVVASGATLIITNGSATNPVFIGGAGVTTANGAVIPPYGILTLNNVTSSQPVYVTAHVIDAGGTPVGVIYGDNQIS